MQVSVAAGCSGATAGASVVHFHLAAWPDPSLPFQVENKLGALGSACDYFEAFQGDQCTQQADGQTACSNPDSSRYESLANTDGSMDSLVSGCTEHIEQTGEPGSGETTAFYVCPARDRSTRLERCFVIRYPSSSGQSYYGTLPPESPQVELVHSRLHDLLDDAVFAPPAPADSARLSGRFPLSLQRLLYFIDEKTPGATASLDLHAFAAVYDPAQPAFRSA